MLSVLPWGAEVSISAAVILLAVIVIQLSFRYLTKSNKFYQERIDELRVDYENRQDKKDQHILDVVGKFNATSIAFNRTVDITLQRVCAEREKEDALLHEFMAQVKTDTSAMRIEHQRQEDNQRTLVANQARVAMVLDRIAERLEVPLNGNSKK